MEVCSEDVKVKIKVGFDDLVTTPVNGGDIYQDSAGFSDGYAAISHADRLTQEPESIRKWREEQKKRLEELDAASKVTEQDWREKAKKDLEEWYLRQSEQMEKNKVSNRSVRVREKVGEVHNERHHYKE
ncbi:clathrin light chain B-like [Ascaphus truei]|uniref:clathrin light chain B-like n=1 Tax=Ascaphus truei TaxID=8439 RepID=UPI003F59274C